MTPTPEQPIQRDAAVTPSIEEQIAQLKDAGWIKVRARLWKAPVGGYFMGPHGAWLAMKRRATTA